MDDQPTEAMEPVAPGGDIPVTQQRKLALITTVSALALLLIGFFAGHSGGANINAAEAAGNSAGAAAGTKAGKKSGYDDGFKKGYSTSYKAAYRKAMGDDK